MLPFYIKMWNKFIYIHLYQQNSIYIFSFDCNHNLMLTNWTELIFWFPAATSCYEQRWKCTRMNKRRKSPYSDCFSCLYQLYNTFSPKIKKKKNEICWSEENFHLRYEILFESCQISNKTISNKLVKFFFFLSQITLPIN